VLTVMPLVCKKLLRKTSGLAMRPLGLEGGTTWSNSDDLAGELGRGVAAEDLGFTRARLGRLLVAGRWSEGMDGVVRRRPPRERVLWQAGGQAQATRSSRTFYSA
jgi:hypothetical protein